MWPSAPAERDVVDVVAGGLGVGAVLAPAGHAAVAPAAGCGPGRRRGRCPSRSVTPGRKPSISASAFSTSEQQRLDAVGVLQVDADRAAAPVQHVGRRGRRDRRRRTAAARSTRITSAPMSASIMAANGPGPMPAISMILHAVRAVPLATSGRPTAERAAERGDGLDDLRPVVRRAGRGPCPRASCSSAPGDHLGGALAAATG